MSVDERIAPFRTTKKMSMDERMRLVQKQFPKILDFDWLKAFGPGEEVTDIFAKLLQDILKVDQAVPGRPGPRPALDYDRGIESLKRLMGQDYSTLPFAEAFRVLCRGKSLTQVARLTGLSRSQVYRLQRGEVEAEFETMEHIAVGFKKHPSYFAEYRTYFVLAHLQDRLMQMPESTIDIYRRVTRGL